MTVNYNHIQSNLVKNLQHFLTELLIISNLKTKNNNDEKKNSVWKKNFLSTSTLGSHEMLLFTVKFQILQRQIVILFRSNNSVVMISEIKKKFSSDL